MKKLLFSMMVLIAAFVLMSCDEEITIELDAPTNVSLTGAVVSWDVVADAEGYRVLVNVTPHNVTGTSFDLGTLGLAPGSYTVTVVATAGTAVSLPSSSVTFVVIDDTELDVPIVSGITDGVLAWAPVDTAQSYVVTVDGTDYPVSTTSFDLGALFLPEGTYSIVVTAVRGDDTSESLPAAYTVAVQLDVNTVYASVLASMNESFVPDMDETDFLDDPWAYGEYLQMSGMAMAYVNAAATSQLTSDEAIELFGMVSDMPMAVGSAENLSAVMLMVDGMMDGMDVGEQEIANILVHLLMYALEQGRAQMNEEFLFFADEVTFAEDALADLMTSQAFLDLYNMFLPFVPSYYLVDFQMMFDNPEAFDDLRMALRNIAHIASDMVHNLESHEPWYLEGAGTYTYMFYDILLAMALSETQPAFLQTLASDPWTTMLPFYNVIDAYAEVNWANEQLASIEQQLLMLDSVEEMLGDDPQMFVNMLGDVLEYVSLVYDTLTQDLVDQIDTLILNGYLTLEESLILKDEIVYVLQTTLPTPEDFEALYTTMFFVAESMSGFDLQFIQSRAGDLADIEHMTLNLLLDVIGDVDQATIEDIMLISEDLIIPGYFETYEYEIEYWDAFLQEWVIETQTDEYWVDDSVNPYTLVDLMVYIVGYAETVKTDYATEIAAIESYYDVAFGDLFIADLVVFVKTLLQQAVSPEEFMMISGMIDELVLDLPNIEAGLAVFGTLGNDLIDWFLLTEGSFFYELFTTAELMNDEMVDPYLAVLQVESLIAEIATLNDVLFAYGDAATIEGVLSAFRVPIMFATMQTGMFQTYADFDLFFDDVVGALSSLIEGFATIESKAVAEADALAVSELMYNSGWVLQGEEALMGVVLLGLDATFSEDIELVFEGMVSTIFDDLLANDLFLMMFELDLLSLQAMRDEVLMTFAGIMDELEVVAGFDYTTVGTLEIDQMYFFFDGLGELFASFLYGGGQEPIPY